MRFNSKNEVKQWAINAGLSDIKRHKDLGHDLNPYCTQGARATWQRGFDNLGARSYENPQLIDFDTQYQRGRACAELLQGAKND